MKRYFLRSLLALAVTGVLGVAPLAHAQDKGPIAISMPTKSSARWIADGANMVKYFQEKGYKTDLQYADSRLSMRAWATAPSQRSVETLSMPSCLLRTTSLPLSM